MDWFFALEGPTQVAIVGVLAGIVAAVSTVAVAALNSNKGGSGGKAEIAALTIDSSAVLKVAASVEALNMTLIEQNKIAVDGGSEMVDTLTEMTKQVEELRREVRALSDKMRT